LHWPAARAGDTGPVCESRLNMGWLGEHWLNRRRGCVGALQHYCIR